MRILLVDDEENVRKAICRALKKLSIEFVQAEDGEEAMVLLQQQQFDLLITDNDMPHMTGLELITIAKEKYPEMPVVLISGKLQASEVPSEILFIPKPWPKNALEKAVSQFLK